MRTSGVLVTVVATTLLLSGCSDDLSSAAMINVCDDWYQEGGLAYDTDLEASGAFADSGTDWGDDGTYIAVLRDSSSAELARCEILLEGDSYTIQGETGY